MFLQDGRLTIRNAAACDAETLCNWWNDGKVMAHAGYPNGLGTSPGKIIRELSGDSDTTHRRLIIEADGDPQSSVDYELTKEARHDPRGNLPKNGLTFH